MRIEDIHRAYRGRLPTRDRRTRTLSEISAEYRRRSEQAMIDSATAATGVWALFLSDEVDSSAIDEPMRQAFELAYPSMSIDSLGELSTSELQGIINGWKGKYFEVLVRDKLNDGKRVGELFLMEGQRAELAASATQEGWDLQIIDDSVGVVEQFQLKASESLNYVQKALDRYPEIEVIATDDVGALSDRIGESGFEDDDLTDRIVEPLRSLLDSGLGDVVEAALPALPFVVIGIDASRRVLVGRQTFLQAAPDLVLRTTKTGAAMGAGAVVSLLDGGWLSVPVAVLVRLSFDRLSIHRAMEERLSRRIAVLSAIHRRMFSDS